MTDMTKQEVKLVGRAWCVGDDIDTDLILPGSAISLPRSERPALMFEANRPGWAAQVRPGDVLVAGNNFGMGSSRPAPQVMKDLGLAAVFAEGINGLFLRNCVNFAFPALEVPGIAAAVTEGDDVEIDFTSGRVRVASTGEQLAGRPWPSFAQEIHRAGGIVAMLEAQGLLNPIDWNPLDEDEDVVARSG